METLVLFAKFCRIRGSGHPRWGVFTPRTRICPPSPRTAGTCAPVCPFCGSGIAAFIVCQRRETICKKYGLCADLFRWSQSSANELGKWGLREGEGSCFPAENCSQGVDRNGGEGEIRTPGSLSASSAFEAGAFNHSATSPHWGKKPKRDRPRLLPRDAQAIR